MQPQVYRNFVEPVLKDWLARQLAMYPQHTGIDLISDHAAVELKSHDIYWQKNTWAFNNDDRVRFEKDNGDKELWFAALEYDVRFRPTDIQTADEARTNVLERRAWLLPWEFLAIISPSKGTKTPWLYISSAHFLQEYTFRQISEDNIGEVLIPTTHDFRP